MSGRRVRRHQRHVRLRRHPRHGEREPAPGRLLLHVRRLGRVQRQLAERGELQRALRPQLLLARTVREGRSGRDPRNHQLLRPSPGHRAELRHPRDVDRRSGRGHAPGGRLLAGAGRDSEAVRHEHRRRLRVDLLRCGDRRHLHHRRGLRGGRRRPRRHRRWHPHAREQARGAPLRRQRVRAPGYAHRWPVCLRHGHLAVAVRAGGAAGHDDHDAADDRFDHHHDAVEHAHESVAARRRPRRCRAPPRASA